MDLANLVNALSADQNEDDYEQFFLQPASSPYNITEKVKKANEALSMDNPNLDEREVKVKFREDLVDYEPSLTEDDVNSIESDEAPEDEDFPKMCSLERSVFSDESVQSVINLKQGDVTLEDVGEEEEVEECGDDEEKPEEFEQSHDECDDDDDDGGEEEEEVAEDSVGEEETEAEAVFSEPEESFEFPEESESEGREMTAKKPKTKRKFSQKNRCVRNQEVDCRSHCIVDLDLGLRIKKLNIQEKTVVRPILKLQERKCCEDSSKIQNLPTYMGFRSEYGLSLEQLERREKINQIIRMKEEKRQQLLREFKERKRQQNEEVFCQWLRNVSKRKTAASTKQKTPAVKETLSPKIINLPPGNKPQLQKARPLTAPLPPKSPFFVRQKRRPQTSPAYVYIQVPHNFLKRGISVGNLYVSLSGGKKKNIDIVTRC